MECIACEFVVGNIVLINFQLTWIVKLQGKQKLKKAFRVSFVTFLLAFSCSFLSVVTVTFLIILVFLTRLLTSHMWLVSNISRHKNKNT